VQFHPAYSYEDFVLGIRPQSVGGALSYPLVPGRFLDFCERASRREGLSVLIIDEINRANLARVFGELMYLLEYRDKDVPLAGGRVFRIPGNVRLIGTMNTADRSIALVDHALRRRFAFLELKPSYETLQRFHAGNGNASVSDRLVTVLRRLNTDINDAHYEIGISFFMVPELAPTLPDIWQMEIEPYLQEYFFDQKGSVEKYRWVNIEAEILGER
jgi:5-methylcytosine-specific restriction protein B